MPTSKSTTTKPTCVLDNAVLNEDTLSEMKDLGLSFFATLCGRNRGAFVLDPSDGQTWGCTQFPSNFAELATGYNATVPLQDANAIVKTYQQGNVTKTETLAYLDYLIKMVYHSTANVQKDAYACNTAGLSKLQCTPVHNIAKIKAVTTTGLFVPAAWATQGETLTLQQRKAFYTSKDFKHMRKMGINTVQIPFPIQLFQTNTAVATDDAESATDRGVVTLLELTAVLQLVSDADLQAILVLVGGDNDNAVAAAANYAADHSNVVFAITVPSEQSYRAARAAQETLKLFVPINQGDIANLNEILDATDPNLFGALDLSHTSTVADVASSTAQDDRMKLFYHESTACIARSPLEYAACHQRVPILVASGFDLAIDDCATQNYSKSFVDYGQCDRLESTTNSGWWHRHRASFAARQLFSYEQGMGWSFAAWKLWNNNNIGTLDAFVKLLSFVDVHAAGLLPDLDDGHVDACLNSPQADFVMGDVTFAPTMAPVDCGYGWWNETIQNCSYWIPPPPTPVPTGCPEVSDNISCPEPVSCPSCEQRSPFPTLEMGGNGAGTLVSGGVGALVGIVLGVIVGKHCSKGRVGYTEVPSVEESMTT